MEFLFHCAPDPKYGLTRSLFEEVVSSVDLHEGVPLVVGELQADGVITAIISGGFKALGDRVQRTLRMDHSFCACEYFFHAGTGFIDYYTQGRRGWVRLHEKGGKRHEMPCNHNLEAYLDAYIAAANIAQDRKGYLFRTVRGRGRTLAANPMA